MSVILCKRCSSVRSQQQQLNDSPIDCMGKKPSKSKKASQQPASTATRAPGMATSQVLGAGVVLAVLLACLLGSLPADSADSCPSGKCGAASEPMSRSLLKGFSEAHNASMFWGSYRPGVYFGMRSRSAPDALVSGVMWAYKDRAGKLQLRHQCRESDNLAKYGWRQHDGTSFGMQLIEDGPLQLQTSFIKQDGDDGWSARVTVDKRGAESWPKSGVAVLLYAAFIDDSEAHTDRSKIRSSTKHSMEVETSEAGIELRAPAQYSPSEVGAFSIVAPAGGVVHANASVVFQGLEEWAEAQLSGGKKNQLGKLPAATDPRASNVLIQYTAQPGKAIGYSLVKHGASSTQLSGEAYTAKMAQLSKAFDSKLATQLPADADAAQLAFAGYATSALVGGIGYFSGSSLERHAGSDQLREGPFVRLFSGVPCRPFFPRGFLWDEGFHQLVAGWWAPAIRRDVLAHWMQLSRADGWIPREQILGVEAITRVPSEFVPQTPDHANPPSLMLVVDKMLKQRLPEDMKLLRQLFPSLRQWFNWFETSQRGKASAGDGYMWRGRSSTDGKLNAMTLASGLDDYPRASHPTEEERHVDLLCWVANTATVPSPRDSIGAVVLRRLATELGEQVMSSTCAMQQLTRVWLQEAAAEYAQHAARLAALLVPLHWNEKAGTFNDVGLHASNGRFEKQVVVQCENRQGQGMQATGLQTASGFQNNCPKSHPVFKWPLGDGHGGLMQREVFVSKKAPRVQHVPHFGYVSLFPMMLRVLQADSPQLGALLTAMRDPKQLWTSWGLRSISKKSEYYGRENAPGDAPYWRGPIWINLQYLALHGLHHYAHTEGPWQQKAATIYGELRQNVMQNLQREWEKTGFLWEQYSDKDGSGQRARPFNGWSSLVVLIIAEDF